MISRRAFLAACGASGAAALTPVTSSGDDRQPAAAGNRIAVSTYSFWQFRHQDLRDIEQCIDLAGEWGFDGVEILHRQMQSEDKGYLQRLKRRAFIHGL